MVSTMQRKVIALLQARSDSSRLPGKVFKDILGKPMIIHQLERVSRAILIDQLILVTSDEPSDDALNEIVLKHGFEIYRGDKNKVIKRFYDALKTLHLHDEDVVVRLTVD